MAEEDNWIVLLPFKGEPVVNTGQKQHFLLLEEAAPQLKREINNWAVGNSAPMSDEHILARGHINHMNRICFQECPGNRNTIYDIVQGELSRQKTAKKTSPFFDPQNILSLLVVRAQNEHVPDEEDLHNARLFSKNIANLPTKDIYECLDSVMSAENPAAAIRLAQQIGALLMMLPEVDETKGFWQKYKKTSSELFSHLLMTLDSVAKHSDNKILRWAALLHDVGKLRAVWVDEKGRTHFHTGPEGQGSDHEKVGCEMAREMLERIEMPEEEIQEICFFIATHMFKHFDDKKGARAFLELMGGEEKADDMLTLRIGDMQGKPNTEEGKEEIAEMRKLIKKVCERPSDWEEIEPDSHIIVLLEEFDII